MVSKSINVRWLQLNPRIHFSKVLFSRQVLEEKGSVGIFGDLSGEKGFSDRKVNNTLLLPDKSHFLSKCTLCQSFQNCFRTNFLKEENITVTCLLLVRFLRSKEREKGKLSVIQWRKEGECKQINDE